MRASFQVVGYEPHPFRADRYALGARVWLPGEPCRFLALDDAEVPERFRGICDRYRRWWENDARCYPGPYMFAMPVMQVPKGVADPLAWVTSCLTFKAPAETR